MKKGFVLIGSLFLIAFVAIFLGTSIMRSDMQLRKITLQRGLLNAFCAAEAGIDRSIAELRMNGEWLPGVFFSNQTLFWIDQTGAQQQPVGIYNVTISDGGMIGNAPTVILASVGQDIVNPRIGRSIRARVTVENPARFFTSTVHKLTLGDGLNITGSILARDFVFEPGSNGISVIGNVEYIRTITGQNSPAVTIDDLDPNTTPDYYPRAPIAFVGVDLDKFRALANTAGRYEAGDYTISGNIDAASLQDPGKPSFNGLVFVEGDIHISGNVQMSVNIISGGNIYIDDSLICDTYVDVHGVTRQYQIGLSAHQDVIIPTSAPNNLTIDAFVIANGGVFEAEKTLNGKASLTFNGAIAIRGEDGLRTGIDLNEYAARNCIYNTDLRNNPQIPFMSYVVNMVEWQEI